MAEFSKGDIVKVAMPAPGREGNRFIVLGFAIPLRDDGTLAQQEAALAVLDSPLFGWCAIQATDLVKA